MTCPVSLQGVSVPPSCISGYYFAPDVSILSVGLATWLTALGLAAASTRVHTPSMLLAARAAATATVFLHPTVSSSALGLVSCQAVQLSRRALQSIEGRFGGSSGASASEDSLEPVSLLVSNPYIECFKGAHVAVGSLACVALALYVTGLPAVTLHMLRRDQWLAIKLGWRLKRAESESRLWPPCKRNRTSRISGDLTPPAAQTTGSIPHPSPLLYPFLVGGDYVPESWFFRHIDMSVVFGLVLLAAFLPLPATLPQLAVKVALTLGFLFALLLCLSVLRNPYKEPWKWYLRVALVFLSISCVVVNGASRALDLGFVDPALVAFIAPASFINVGVLSVAVVVALVFFLFDPRDVQARQVGARNGCWTRGTKRYENALVAAVPDVERVEVCVDGDGDAAPGASPSVSPSVRVPDVAISDCGSEVGAAATESFRYPAGDGAEVVVAASCEHTAVECAPATTTEGCFARDQCAALTCEDASVLFAAPGESDGVSLVLVETNEVSPHVGSTSARVPVLVVQDTLYPAMSTPVPHSSPSPVDAATEHVVTLEAPTPAGFAASAYVVEASSYAILAVQGTLLPTDSFNVADLASAENTYRASAVDLPFAAGDVVVSNSTRVTVMISQDTPGCALSAPVFHSSPGPVDAGTEQSVRLETPAPTAFTTSAYVVEAVMHGPLTVQATVPAEMPCCHVAELAAAEKTHLTARASAVDPPSAAAHAVGEEIFIPQKLHSLSAMSSSASSLERGDEVAPPTLDAVVRCHTGRVDNVCLRVTMESMEASVAGRGSGRGDDGSVGTPRALIPMPPVALPGMMASARDTQMTAAAPLPQCLIPLAVLADAGERSDGVASRRTGTHHSSGPATPGGADSRGPTSAADVQPPPASAPMGRRRLSKPAPLPGGRGAIVRGSLPAQSTWGSALDMSPAAHDVCEDDDTFDNSILSAIQGQHGSPVRRASVGGTSTAPTGHQVQLPRRGSVGAVRPSPTSEVRLGSAGWAARRGALGARRLSGIDLTRQAAWAHKLWI